LIRRQGGAAITGEYVPFAPSLCRPIICAVALSAAPAALAETPRELLTAAAFQTSDKARALSLIGQAISAADRILMTAPNDHEAVLQRAVANVSAVEEEILHSIVATRN
jgi:hypothetical protein